MSRPPDRPAAALQRPGRRRRRHGGRRGPVNATARRAAVRRPVDRPDLPPPGRARHRRRRCCGARWRSPRATASRRSASPSRTATRRARSTPRWASPRSLESLTSSSRTRRPRRTRGPRTRSWITAELLRLRHSALRGRSKGEATTDATRSRTSCPSSRLDGGRDLLACLRPGLRGRLAGSLVRLAMSDIRVCHGVLLSLVFRCGLGLCGDVRGEAGACAWIARGTRPLVVGVRWRPVWTAGQASRSASVRAVTPSRPPSRYAAISASSLRRFWPPGSSRAT